MQKLSKELFNEIKVYMNKESRPLERAIFNYYFNDSNGDDILDMLEKFQNSDGWCSVPVTVNGYPHAPWWKHRNDIGMTAIDYSWGNPTAELIGYLYEYREYVTKLDIFSLVKYAIDNLNEHTEFNSDNFFGIDNKFIDKNLDYLIAKLEENKKMLPTWEWDNYLDEWKISKIEWMGILTLEALLSLKKFNRL